MALDLDLLDPEAVQERLTDENWQPGLGIGHWRCPICFVDVRFSDRKWHVRYHVELAKQIAVAIFTATQGP